MKKIYLSLLSSLFCLGLNAQVTITKANHEPTAGDQYSTYQIDSTTVSAGGNGAALNWNFAIVTHSSILQNYTTTAATNSIWPSASVAISSSTLPGSFYSGTLTDLKYWGGFLTLGGVTAELRFANPASYMAYPTALNGGTTSAISGTILALSQVGSFTGVCTVTAQATGTMVLPAKTFSNVIRVTNSVSISFTAGGIPGTAQQVTQDWYSLSDSKYPILSLSQSTLSGLGTSIQKYAFVQKNYQLVGVNENTPLAYSMNVYPNPASNYVNFVGENENAKQVTIYDITGKAVETQVLNSGKTTVNTANYNNGLYIYKIIDNNGRSLKTGRLTVNH